MGFLSDLTEYFRRPPTINANRVSRVIATGLVDKPLPHPHDFGRFTDEGYRRNVIIYACVKFWAATAGHVRLVAKRGDKHGENELLPAEHPLAMLLQKPNAEQSQPAYMRELITFLQVTGNSYGHKVRPRARSMPPVELWQLRPDRTKVQPDATGFVAGYRFPSDAPGGGKFLPVEDMLHIKLDDPGSDYYGLSPIATLARQGDIDNEAADFIRSVFMNAGMPAAIFRVSQGATKEELDGVEQRFADKFARGSGPWESDEFGRHANSSGRGRVAFFANDIELLASGSMLSQIMPEEIFGHTESRICAGFGVSPILIGLKVGLQFSTYSNFREALKDFWVNGAGPAWGDFGDSFTNDIAHEYGDDIFIEADLSKVDALKEDRQMRATRGKEGWEIGVMRLNEARSHYGLDPEEGPEGEMRVFDFQPMRAAPVGGTLTQGRIIDAKHIDVSRVTDALRAIRETLALPADVIPKEPIWKKAHTAADEEAPKMRRAVRKAIAEAQNAVILVDVEDALKNKDSMRIESDLQKVWDEHATPELERVLVPALARIHQEGAKAGNTELPRETQAGGPDEVLATVTPLQSDNFAETVVANLVTQVSEGTKLAIRGIIDKMFEEGFSARVAATRIRGMLGLTVPQAKTLLRFEDELRELQTSAAAIEELLAKRVKKMIRQRAIMISRTEGIRAVSEGQASVWKAAVDEGVIDAGQERFWIVVDDERNADCPICPPMQGQVRGLTEAFETGTGAAIDMPPAHPSCRCVIGLK